MIGHGILYVLDNIEDGEILTSEVAKQAEAQAEVKAAPAGENVKDDNVVDATFTETKKD